MYEIVKYEQEHEIGLLTVLKEDNDWDFFTKPDSIENFKTALEDSVTYVCLKDDTVCGYIRGIIDYGFGLYISELFVAPDYRNKRIGRNLLKTIKSDFSSIDIYVMSDEDIYYEKLGYDKVGSIFKL